MIPDILSSLCIAMCSRDFYNHETVCVLGVMPTRSLHTLEACHLVEHGLSEYLDLTCIVVTFYMPVFHNVQMSERFADSTT